MRTFSICLSLILVTATAFAQGLDSHVDARTNAQGYPTSRSDYPTPSLRRFSRYEKKLWQARENGNTEIINKLMSKDVRIASMAGLKDNAQWIGKAQWIAAIESGACRLKSFKLTNFVADSVSLSAATFTYRAEQDIGCNGKSLPASVNVVSKYLYLDGAWQNTFYQETPATLQSVARPED